MKINTKNYPALELLFEKKEFTDVKTLKVADVDVDVFKNKKYLELIKAASANIKPFIQKVYVISPAFMEAAMKAAPKLVDVLQDFTYINPTMDFHVCGTYIIGKNLYFYKRTIYHQKDMVETILFEFTKEGEITGILIDDPNVFENTFFWLSQNRKEHIHSQSQDDERMYFMQCASYLTIVEMFKTYAEVEIKMIPPQKTEKKLQEIEYIKNESPFDIEYLSSKWFTKIVRSEGFKVRGHFRLQAIKIDKLRSHKLIWIEEFQKKGYTSKAKIEKTDE